MRADDPRLLGIPRSRLIIAIIYPNHDARSKDYPGLPTKVSTRCMHQCSARAAQDI